MRDKNIIQLVGLLILIFFVVEYVEPSAIGVRIGGIPPSSQSSTKEKSTSVENTGTMPPHAMVWNSSILISSNLVYHKFQNFPETFVCKLFSLEIFHPPLISVY